MLKLVYNADDPKPETPAAPMREPEEGLPLGIFDPEAPEARPENLSGNA